MPGNVPVIEDVPKLTKGVTDVVVANKNNADVRVGVDRPPEDNNYTLNAPLNDGEPDTGTIDIVVGRESRDPNYDTDKSRVYISSQTNGDTNFGLTAGGFLEGDDTIQTSDGNAYVITKSDSIRLLGRNDVRIQVQETGASITLKADGDIVIHTPDNLITNIATDTTHNVGGDLTNNVDGDFIANVPNKIKLGSQSADTENLVLGQVFKEFAGKLLDTLASMKHVTAHGPMPVFGSDIAKFKQIKGDYVSNEKILSGHVFTEK